MEELIDNIVEALYISEDQTMLIFETQKRDYIFEVYGDNSIEVKFERLKGLENLIGARVENVVDGTWDSTFDGELEREVFDIDIVTDKGITNLTVKNLHINDFFFRAAFIDELPEEHAINYDFKRIKKDF